MRLAARLSAHINNSLPVYSAVAAVVFVNALIDHHRTLPLWVLATILILQAVFTWKSAEYAMRLGNEGTAGMAFIHLFVCALAFERVLYHGFVWPK